VNKSFAIMPIVVAAWNYTGDPQIHYTRWISTGARPIWFINEYASLAFEAGFDNGNDGRGRYSGWLRKFTLAPQIATGPEFFSRPVLRLLRSFIAETG
jgi:maltoporin